MELDVKSIDELCHLFRDKMHDIYRKNNKKKVLFPNYISEYNAWQNYLRENLKLEVVEVIGPVKTGFIKNKDLEIWIKIMNPSNASGYGQEYIIIPEDIAEKILLLKGLPDKL